MPYTVILPTGRIMQFYIRSLAETYASMYKGTLITSPHHEPQTPVTL